MLPQNHNDMPALGKLAVDFRGNRRDRAAEQDQIIGRALPVSQGQRRLHIADRSDSMIDQGRPADQFVEGRVRHVPDPGRKNRREVISMRRHKDHFATEPHTGFDR